MIPRELEKNSVIHEVELGMVIGKKAVDLQPSDFQSGYIGGYYLLIDYGYKPALLKAMEKGTPWYFSKTMDGFLYLGDFIEQDKIKDPHNVELELKVNNQVR